MVAGNTPKALNQDLVVHQGACHCGEIKFEVDAPADITAEECNCSICTMTGYQRLIAAPENFRRLSGKDQLLEYTFNTGVARHLFLPQVRDKGVLRATITSQWLQH